ncbi:MAG: ATP-dependent Clp protease adaptor ClpS [Bacteroidales bacterium]|jgi:ATP-dependent Clp protease adaptor protein ClpS|nr:ATP-dependent Clp protease adaptor ClpS [Bacteroidales bacterium]
MVKEKEIASTSADGTTTDLKQLVLLNDDVNTFDFVIETLVEVCHHTPEQAETCAFIVHFKGKCAVKSGSKKELLPYFRTLSNRNLTVEID